jgi:hypothetical protein
MAGRQQCHAPTMRGKLTGLPALSDAWHTHLSPATHQLTCIFSPQSCERTVVCTRERRVWQRNSWRASNSQLPARSSTRATTTRETTRYTPRLARQTDYRLSDVSATAVVHIHTCPPPPLSLPLSPSSILLAPSTLPSLQHHPSQLPRAKFPPTPIAFLQPSNSSAQCTRIAPLDLARVHWLVNTLFAL